MKGPLRSLRDDRVVLRPLEEADLPLTLAWRNQDHIRRWFFNSDLINPDQHSAWFERYRDRDDDYTFVIEEVRDLHRPVGQVALYHIDRAGKRGEFGRLMIGDPEAPGRGLAQRATRLLVEEALGGMGLEEVYLEVYADNARSIAVYRACGFQAAGVRENVLTMFRRRGG